MKSSDRNPGHVVRDRDLDWSERGSLRTVENPFSPTLDRAAFQNSAGLLVIREHERSVGDPFGKCR